MNASRYRPISSALRLALILLALPGLLLTPSASAAADRNVGPAATSTAPATSAEETVIVDPTTGKPLGTATDPVPVKVSGDPATPIPVQGNVAAGSLDSGNPVKSGCVYNTATPTLTNGLRGDCQMGTRGSQNVTLFLADSSSAVGSTTSGADAASNTVNGLRVLAYQMLYNGTTWDREKKPSTASRILSAAATTNATSAKASAGDLFRINGYNANAAARYLKFYNKASAPTVGTDTPILTLYLPPSARFEFDMGGEYFSTGIAYAITTGGPDNDTGALTAGDILALNITYQ